jgi:hypothetical protein
MAIVLGWKKTTCVQATQQKQDELEKVSTHLDAMTWD